MYWKGTYADGTSVRGNLTYDTRWAELDRARLASVAIYAHSDDLAPVLEVDVPIGYRVLQRVRSTLNSELTKAGVLSLESDDRSQVKAWDIRSDGDGVWVTLMDAPSAAVWAPNPLDFEQQVRTA